MAPNPIKFIMFGSIHGPKTYKLIWFGGSHGPKPSHTHTHTHKNEQKIHVHMRTTYNTSKRAARSKAPQPIIFWVAGPSGGSRPCSGLRRIACSRASSVQPSVATPAVPAIAAGGSCLLRGGAFAVLLDVGPASSLILGGPLAVLVKHCVPGGDFRIDGLLGAQALAVDGLA